MVQSTRGEGDGRIVEQRPAMERYWSRNNPMRDISREPLARPVLCINAADDPVCTAANIDHKIFDEREDAMLMLTESGSHMCFFEGVFWPQDNRAEVVALQYLDALAEFWRQQRT